jgi:hypothetical protein
MDVVELAPHMRPAVVLGHGRGLPVRGLIQNRNSRQPAGSRGTRSGARADARPGDRASSDRRPPVAPGPRRAVHPADRPTAGRSWSCRCPARQNRHRRACSLSAVITWSTAALTSGAASAVTLPTHAAMMARSRSTPFALIKQLASR